MPEDVPTANKTGELAAVENDAAIVFAPFGTYILCVMSDDVYLGVATQQTAELSEAIYTYLADNLKNME